MPYDKGLTCNTGEDRKDCFILNICAIVIFAIILFATYIRRATKGTTNRLFLILIWMGFISTCADLITELMIRRLPLTSVGIVVVNICLYAYFVIRNGMIVVYLFFIFSVTHTIFRMMQDIRKELVIEGVERREDLDALIDIGVDFIQGYYFSKPLPADEFVAFLREQRNAG